MKDIFAFTIPLRVAKSWGLPLIFIVVAGAASVFFATKTPLFWGQDEETHFARSFQLSHGIVSAKNLDAPGVKNKGYGGQIPQAAYDAIGIRTKDIVEDAQASDDRHKVDYGTQYTSLGRIKLNERKTSEYGFSNTAVYSPVAYVLPSLALWLSSALSLDLYHSLVFARLSCALFYILCVALGLRSLAKSEVKWLLFIVSLFPTAIYQASTLSADSVINGLSLLIAALCVKGLFLEDQLEGYETALLLVAAILLPLAKVNYIFISALVLAMPTRRLKVYYAKFIPTLTLLIALVISLVWNLHVAPIAKTLGTIIGPAGRNFSVVGQAHWLLLHPLSGIIVFLRTIFRQQDDLLQYVFGQLSAAMIKVPIITTIFFFTGLLLALLYSANEISAPRLRSIRFLCIILLIVGTIASIFLTLYLTFTNVGGAVILGVQGRYFIPLLFPLLVVTARILKRLGVTLSVMDKRIVQGGVPLLTIVGLFVAIVNFYVVMF